VQTYYITDRSQFAGDESERRRKLLLTIGRAAAAGVDAIQLREKDLPICELERLAQEALRVVRGEGSTKLLINHRSDVALAVGADGVHLTGLDIGAGDVRTTVATSGCAAGKFLIAVSCHSAAEVRVAKAERADFAVLAPIFEKVNASREGIGLEELQRAVRGDETAAEESEKQRSFPVFALGGVTLERAALCAAAGASGIAGIRLFQQADDLAAVVGRLRLL
jgi:thiamine-phosphate pyrophosphorylase